MFLLYISQNWELQAHYKCIIDLYEGRCPSQSLQQKQLVWTIAMYPLYWWLEHNNGVSCPARQILTLVQGQQKVPLVCFNNHQCKPICSNIRHSEQALQPSIQSGIDDEITEKNIKIYMYCSLYQKKYVDAQCTNITSLCPVSFFLIQTAQWGEPKTLCRPSKKCFKLELFVHLKSK